MIVLLAPDKFKGSLSAQAVCTAITQGIHQRNEKIVIVSCPMADGGDGALEILDQYEDLDTVQVTVSDPLFRPILASYRRCADTAYIEMATASGLLLLQEDERNCMYTSSFGTGQLILDAIQKGAKNIYLFIGGSATNDGGIGMAAALGYRFLDKLGQELRPIGKSLTAMAYIDDEKLLFNRNDIKVKVISDVENPLTGKEGAAWVYGWQKGANEEEISQLDQGLKMLSNQLVQQGYPDINQRSGAGAAGGLGGGAIAFLGAQLISGISFFIEKTKIEARVKEVDIVITGEGSLDQQSLKGKVIDGIGRLAQKHHKTLVILCGRSEFQTIPSLNAHHIYSIMDISTSEKEAMENAAAKLSEIVSKLDLQKMLF